MLVLSVISWAELNQLETRIVSIAACWGASRKYSGAGSRNTAQLAQGQHWLAAEKERVD